MGYMKCNTCGMESLRFHQALDYDKECPGEYTRITVGHLTPQRLESYNCDECGSPINGGDVCIHLESLPFRVLKQDRMEHLPLLGNATVHLFSEKKLQPALREHHGLT